MDDFPTPPLPERTLQEISPEPSARRGRGCSTDKHDIFDGVKGHFLRIHFWGGSKGIDRSKSQN